MTGHGLRPHTRRHGMPSPWDLAWAEVIKENRPSAGLREARKRSSNYLEEGGCGGNGRCQCSAKFLSRAPSRWGHR